VEKEGDACSCSVRGAAARRACEPSAVALHTARRGCQLSVWVAVSLEWKLQPPGLGWCRQGRDRPEELCLLCWGSLWVKAAKALASFVFVD
jgi:hypothetical protein